jgi:type IV secretory pathway VirB4 component
VDPLVSAVIALTAPGAIVLSLEARRLFASTRPTPIDAGPCHQLADELPYKSLISPEIVKLKRGAYLCAWEIAGADVGGLEDEEVRKATLQVAAMMGLLPPKAGVLGRSNLQLYLMPSPYHEYVRGTAFDDPVLELIDDRRADLFLRRKPIFRTKRVVVLTWDPPSNTIEWFSRKASAGIAAQRRAEDMILADNETLRTRIESALNTRLLSTRRLGEYTELDGSGVHRKRSELLGFIRQCIDGSTAPLNVPHPDIPLGEFFSTTVVPGHEPKIGLREVSYIHFLSWPETAVPRMLAKLNESQIEHAFCIRVLPKTTAKAKKASKKAIYEFMGLAKGNAGFTDTDAQKGQEQAVTAYGLAAGDYTRNGDVTYGLVVRAGTREELRRLELRLVEIVEDAGFRAVVRKDGALDSILATLPGMFARGNRRPQLDAYLVAKTFDVHEPAMGERWSEAESYPPQTPPLTYALGPGNTLVRVHLHGRKDVGHAAMLGEIGRGKSVQFALIAASACGRAPNTGCTIIDRGDSSQQFVETAGGQYIRLMDDRGYAARGLEPPGFALFENCDDPDEAVEIQTILETMLKVNGVVPTPARSKAIAVAIELLGKGDVEDRSMLIFGDTVVDPDVTMRPVFAKYNQDGVLGSMLDRTRDSFRVSKLNAINIDRVMEQFEKSPEYLIPILLVIIWKTVTKVRRMKRNLGGRGGELRWLYLFDEFNNAFLRHPIGAGIANDLFLMGRKESFALWVASNSLTQVAESADFETLKQSCATFWFAADATAMNGAALEGEARKNSRYGLYADRYGVPDRGIRMIADAGDYEWVRFLPSTGFVQRLNFAIDPDVLAILGTSHTAHKPAEFQKRYPEAEFGPWRWRAELIREKSPEAADRFLQIVARWGEGGNIHDNSR